jgi:hypothetical protein
VHAGLLGGFTIADGEAYAESVVSGQVFTDDETISTLARPFDTIRGEAMRVSESAALIRETAQHERLAQVKLQRGQRRQLRRDSQQ